MDKWDREEALDYLDLRFPNLSDFDKDLILCKVEKDIEEGKTTVEDIDIEYEPNNFMRYSGMHKERIPAVARDGTVLEYTGEENQDLEKSIISA